VPLYQLIILSVYPSCDLLQMTLSTCLLRNVVRRKQMLLEKGAPLSEIPLEKKEADFFDIKFFPDDYLSPHED
jgi:hypothetical protein